MTNMKIEQIEGIGPSYAEKLRAAEVSDTDTLLEIGCTKGGSPRSGPKDGHQRVAGPKVGKHG